MRYTVGLSAPIFIPLTPEGALCELDKLEQAQGAAVRVSSPAPDINRFAGYVWCEPCRATPRAAHRPPAARPRRQGQTPPRVGAQGQPLAMRSVPVPRPLRALRAGRPPKAALDGQRGGIHLLPGIFRQPVYQVCPQLLESAPEPADPPVKLALVRRAPVLADFLQESGFAGPSQDMPDRRRCRQALVPAFSPL
jgi:hypothetical protein